MEDEANYNFDELDGLMRAMRLEVSQEECPNVIQILDSVVNVSKTLIEETTEVVIDEVFLTLLGHKSKQIVAKTAKAIAEIAKTDRRRKKCTTIELIRALIDLLKEEDIDILTQACRALGNICHKNENGKNLMREQDGLKVILTVLQKGIVLDNVEDASSLWIEATQFLYNFLEGQKALCMKALEEDMLPILCSILELCFQNGISNGVAVGNMCITLDILNNENIVFLDERLTRVLIDIMTSDISFDELSMRCLQIFLGQAKDEKAKLLLAKAGACEWLLKLLEKYSPQYKDEGMRIQLKHVRNLIILISTGNDCMKFIYGDGEGPVYRKMMEWLDSVDKELRNTAILVMGKFAQTETYCKCMIESGVNQTLLKLVERFNDESADFKYDLNRALFSFLEQQYRGNLRVSKADLSLRDFVKQKYRRNLRVSKADLSLRDFVIQKYRQ